MSPTDPADPPPEAGAADPAAALEPFQPLIRQWFTEQVGTPTDVQAAAWPRIAAGDSVLVTAPTGSGKTLTAFLWALDRLVSGAWPEGTTSVLYVSPLKALNNDIRRNLLTPLEQLRAVFAEAGAPFPAVRALTRSGDTPPEERRRMLRQPPEILITTPESLNILLSSQGGRGLLMGLQSVILDEIHAVVGNKRGVHLITAVDRLVRLSGEFQRIALSATVRPLEQVAEFVGGYRRTGGSPGAAEYEPRPVTVLRSAATKVYDVQVRFPPEAADPEAESERDSIWPALVADFRAIIERNRSTLVFANARRLCEKITRFLNEDRDRPLAYAHHGSLSREIREVVEARLKAGELQAIVATNSLEMGIDIGALDEVVLVQSPPSVSSAVQRVGRAGHQVGQVSRATLYPTHSHDFLEAAVLAARIEAHDIEAARPVRGALDVLAQILVSMAGTESWDLDELFDEVRCSYPYRHLSRRQFDLVVDMLAGRYAGSRIRELRPRLTVDRLDHTVTARKGALFQVYTAGGTIADRGLFKLRLADSNAVLGELDEEFVWESSEGQSFTLGAQNWTIQKITHNDVFVAPAPGKVVDLPFWKGEGGHRDFHFSDAIGCFLEDAEAGLGEPAFRQRLLTTHHMDEIAADQLLAFLQRQRLTTDTPLPHRHHLLVEWVRSGPGGHAGTQLVLHTFWGGRVNRPYALALDAAWEERFGSRLEIYPTDDCIVLVLPDEIAADELLSLVTSSRVETLLRARLEASGFFGARFRECAQRALLLTRRSMTERMPLWLSRLRSQKLLDAVMRYEDFPVLVETWRTCLQDEFDMPALATVLAELEAGTIAWSESRTARPSPFAQAVAWGQVNQYMYMDDSASGRQTSQLRGDLLREVLFSPDLRPAVPAGIVRRYEARRQRLHDGYAPTEARELVDWVDERLLLPWPEWERLEAAARRDAASDDDDTGAAAALFEPCADRVVRLEAPGLETPLVAALQALPRLAAALPWWPRARVTTLAGRAVTGTAAPAGAAAGDGTDEEGGEAGDDPLGRLLGDWLAYYGPLEPARVAAVLGLSEAQLLPVIDGLVEAQAVVTGTLLEGAGDEQLCDAGSFESLLRMARADAAPAFQALPVEHLAHFLAVHHGLHEPGGDTEALRRRLEPLLGLAVPAAQWEGDILPARMRAYSPALLDGVLQESVLRWVGCGDQRLAFCFESDLDLLAEEAAARDGEAPPAQHDAAAAARALFPDPHGRYDFSALQKASRLDTGALAERLWSAAWAGAVTNDTFGAVRRGVETRFEPPEAPAAGTTPGTRRRPGAGGGRWRGAAVYPGSWFLLPPAEPADDPLDAEERNKDRARLLLDRYGVLFRELTRRELPPFAWRRLFRALRLMELSGEVLAGRFFEGVPGPQFASHRAFRQLSRGLPADAVWWVAATDPAAVCGLGLAELRGLPRRVPSTHLVYHGARLVLESVRHGAQLSFGTTPDDGRLLEYFAPLQHLLTRPVQALRSIEVESIDGEPAAGSPFADALRTAFQVHRDHHKLILVRG